MIDISTAIDAIAAGIAIAGGAVGTAMAQAAIGSSGMGLLAEKPEMTGQVLIYLVIPETIVIFGLIVAILILLGAGFI
mgnify:CR=1 FL=1